MSKRTLSSDELGPLLEDAARQLLLYGAKLASATVNIALTGGRTTGSLFEAMVRDAGAISAQDWSRFRFFLADERLVPRDHPDSNFRAIHEQLFLPLSRLGLVDEEQIYPPPVELTDPTAIASSYADSLHSVGGRIDIAILSSGEDGHVASLFPHHPALTNEADFLTLSDSPKPPPARLSIGYRHLQQAPFVVLLFVGDSKRDALLEFNDPSLSVADCPAKLVNGAASLLVIVHPNSLGVI